MSQCAGAVKQALLAAADAALLSLPGAAGDNRWQHGPVTSGEVDCPAWLRQAILARAQACIRGWHADTLRQLGLLLEAESLCPAAERFEQLKLKLAGLVEASAAELVAAAAPAPAPPATGGSMQALVAADQQQASLHGCGALIANSCKPCQCSFCHSNQQVRPPSRTVPAGRQGAARRCQLAYGQPAEDVTTRPLAAPLLHAAPGPTSAVLCKGKSPRLQTWLAGWQAYIPVQVCSLGRTCPLISHGSLPPNPDAADRKG